MTKQNFTHLPSGFTLVELMVVIAIIGVLVASTFIVLKPQTFFAQSRDARRQSDLKVVQTALEQYYAQNYDYPGSLPFGAAWVVNNVTYLRLVPNDPDSNKSYCYAYDSTNKSYELCASTEEKVANSLDGSLPACTFVAPSTNNYCLTNPF